MMNGLTINYDREGDILFIHKCPPYGEQEMEELDDEILVRLNPETDTIEAIEIFFFSKRLDNPFTLPIVADLQLPQPAMLDA
ncbi:MAG: DUF2283 domain-containing protein [Coleofasciculaceae cyanobacterium RL_1_1]|nr:DUF2283 domain-containing protein [Coleofasciculaceae cyanobacterium RL_1_1]